MSRYTGPKVKKMRAVGVDLPGLSRKTIADRAYPPGQHGQTPRRRKQSEYKMQLMEKQKVRMNYGLTEKQLRTLVEEARRSKVATGDKLVELLERRLDNAIKEGNKESAQAALNAASSAFDKAAKLKVIHSAKADRKKSRLASRANAAG